MRMRLLALCYLLCAAFTVQSQSGDKTNTLRHRINNEKNDTTKAKLCNELAWELRFTDIPEALRLADEEIRIGYLRKNELCLARGYQIKALTLVIDEQIMEGMACYDSSIAHAKKANYPRGEIMSYNLIGGMYGDHSDYDKAIEYYHKALQLAQSIRDSNLIATASNNLAESYQSDKRDSRQTQRYFLLSLQYSIGMQNWGYAAMTSANLSQEYANQKQATLANKELQRAVHFMELSKSDAYRFATTCHVLASVFFDLGELGQSERYALQSVRIMDSLQRPDNVLRPLSTLAKIYTAQKNITAAQAYSQRLLRDAQAQDAKIYIRDAYKNLSDIARLQGNDKQALAFYEQYKIWNDSVFEIGRERSIANVEMRARIAQEELEVKYESAAKQKENETLKTVNDALQSEKIIALIACVILLLFGGFLYYFNRRSVRMNKALQREKKRVEKQAKEKETLLHEIHHRVKNNLTTLKSLLYLQAKTAQGEETKRILKESQTRIQSMALVHQNLYDDNENGQLDFVAFLNTLFQELTHTFAPYENDIEFHVKGSCRELNISKAIPLGLIMNELFTNSIKYAWKEDEQGEISISIEDNGNELIIRYSDNGPGLNKEFDLQKGGFGFRVMDILSQQLFAHILYENNTFVIRVPL